MADPVTLAVAGTAVTAGSTLIGGFMKADATEEAGRMQEISAGHDAKQLEMASAESRAAAQRQMFERQRATRLALSSLRARAGMGGDSATSEDALKLTSDIAGRGEYQALAELYTGENRARGLSDQASAKLFEGRAARYSADTAAGGLRMGSVLSSTGTLLSGLGQAGKDRAKINYDAGRYG